MNFKFQEFKDVLLNRQGMIPIAINFGFQVALALFIFVPFFFIMMGMGMTDPYAMETGEMDAFMALMILLICIFLMPFMIYIQAATYGSIKDCIEHGSMLGFKKFLSNGFKYFLPVLGYGLLLGLIICTIAVPVLLFTFAIMAVVEPLGLILYFLALIVLVIGSLLMSPLVYLSVVEGNAFSHLKTLLKKNWKELLVAGIAVALLNNVPFLGTAAVLLFPLYVMVLFYDFPKEEKIASDVTLEDNSMEVIEEIVFEEIKEEKKED